jgi:hypothetical protein
VRDGLVHLWWRANNGGSWVNAHYRSRIPGYSPIFAKDARPDCLACLYVYLMSPLMTSTRIVTIASYDWC